jgi:hypothetical protein
MVSVRCSTSSNARATTRGARRLVIILLSGWFASGCGYTVAGLSEPAAISNGTGPTLAVPLLDNRTDEPLMSQIVTERLKHQFLASGPWRLVNTDGAPELTLTGRVAAVELTPVSFDVDSRVTEYHLELRVDLALTRSHDGAVLWSIETLTGGADYYVNEDVAATQRSKERSLRDAGQRIAERASHAVRLALSAEATPAR